MKITTHFAHQVQSTRLYDTMPDALPLHVNGVLTLFDAFFQKDLRRRITLAMDLKTTIQRQAADLHFELFPVQSPLLRESCSFSFPPLTYMLKFSG